MANHVTGLPVDPSGGGAFVGWCRKISKCIRERSIIPGPGIKVAYMARGVIIEAEAKETAAAAPAPIQWRGEWRDTETYVQNDIVIRGSRNASSAGWNHSDNILMSGAKAGVYIALSNVPAGVAPTEPNSTAYWETLARFGSHIIALVDGVPGGQDTDTASKIMLNAKSPNGSIVANLSDCNGKALTIREVEVCVSGLTKHMMVLASAPY